jgi:hypothetical protein
MRIGAAGKGAVVFDNEPSWRFTRRAMDLTALLVEIRRRARVLPPPNVDPLRAIYQHCAAMPSDSAERKTLQQLTLGIIQGSVGAIDENEVWKLGPVVLGLLDAFIERRLDKASVLTRPFSRADFTPAHISPARANGPTVQRLQRNTAARRQRLYAPTYLRQ